MAGRKLELIEESLVISDLHVTYELYSKRRAGRLDAHAMSSELRAAESMWLGHVNCRSGQLSKFSEPAEMRCIASQMPYCY